MELRPYQEKAIDAICTAYDQGWRQQILSMATGSGKTVVFSALYERLKSRLNGKMLILAHTEELIDQSIATMKSVNPSLRIDKEMADHKATPSEADVVVASVASLGRLNTPRLSKYDVSQWSTVIVDEAHHTPANSYMNILDAFRVLEDGTKKLLLGVTATPQRSDGKALGDIYKKMVYSYSLRQAIEDGFLVKVRGYRVTTNSDISNVSMTAGDLNTGQLVEAIDNPDRNKRVVSAWIQWGEGRQTVVYAASIEHAQSLSAAFNDAGVPSAAIWGSDSDRATKLTAHRTCDLRVLVNCALLNEGWDSPSVSCIVHASPTASSVRFTQRCGRATRLFEGKVDCIILDVVDICVIHSLCTLPMLMGMPAALDLQGQSITDAVQLIEEMQDEHSNVDFSKLKDIEKIKQFIEEVNLFEIRFPKEVEESSELRWCRAVDGGYTMKILRPKTDTTGTKPGRVRIYENVIGQWEIRGEIKERQFLGLRNSVEEAFACADQQIRERSPESMVLLNRKAGWTNKPATKPQKILLSRLYGKAKPWPEDLTQGQASFFIDQRIGGKQ